MKRQKISFLLNKEMREIEFTASDIYTPFTTMLEYLRGKEACKSVKEGCGIGDCGACTIVLGIPSTEGKLLYKAVNSCLLLLPMVHGCQVITSEHLEDEGNLHPVQDAIVETYGSQCGYCTPGIVMSMFALYKENGGKREAIHEALQGNLCRCTGYKSIEEAADLSMQSNGIDQFTSNEQKISRELTDIRKDNETIKLLSGGLTYYKTFTIEDALELKKKMPGAELISGSTDSSLEFRKGRIPENVIDISSIPELKKLEITEEGIEIGSSCPLQDILKINDSRLDVLKEMISVFASKQIRNLATLGGNLSTASPIGDLIPIMLAMEARIKLLSSNGIRVLEVGDFIKGYRKTDIHTGEILHSIIIPDFNTKKTFIKSYKISKRNDVDISSVSACFSVIRDNEGKVSKILLAYGGMDDHPRRALLTEKELINKTWCFNEIQNAAKILQKEFNPISDHRSSDKGRRIAAANLMHLFYNESLGIE